jgi:predicted ATPase
MVERNLDQLDADDQRMLEAASAAGEQFSVAAVAAGLERSPETIETCCTRLARREQFIGAAGVNEWADGTVTASYRFHHALYREVLYERAPAGQRMELHRRIADREESAYGDGAGAIATELADHYARGNDHAKAIKYLKLAGEVSSKRGAMVEAERHYSRALELLSALPDNLERVRRELELQLAVGPALIAIRGFAAPETERAYSRALELCERLGDLPEVFPTLFGIWVMHFLRGEFSKAYRLAAHLLRKAQISSDLPRNFRLRRPCEFGLHSRAL